MKRYILFLSTVVSLLVIPWMVFGQIVITEIMYDVEGTDTGREWIEVQNTGSEPVDLSLWKLFEGNVNHKITGVESAFIPAGGFAIIADVPDKFRADNTGFSGLLFDSVFSLTNEGETFSMKDPAGVESDSVSYTSEWGAQGNGFSLQKTNDGQWIEATPTPGGATTATQSEVVIDENSGESGAIGSESTSSSQNSQSNSAHASQVIANTDADIIQLKVTSGRMRLGFVGSPLSFRARIESLKNATGTVEHLWSMGDGTVKYGDVVSHTYRFAGTYAVILNSSIGRNYSRTENHIDAVSKVEVHIKDPNISIVSANNSYIELRNDNDFEFNAGGWILDTSNKRFVIGADTIILPKHSIRFSSVTTGLGDIKEFVYFINPLGDVYGSIQVADKVDPIIELPSGMTIEQLRKNLLNLINVHEK